MSWYAEIGYLLYSFFDRDDRIHVVIEIVDHIAQIDRMGGAQTQNLVVLFQIKIRISGHKRKASCPGTASEQQSLVLITKGTGEYSSEKSFYHWCEVYGQR